MGEAKRRKVLGLPPREVKTNKKDEKFSGKLYALFNKYPLLPYILGISLLIILIIDLINYYK